MKKMKIIFVCGADVRNGELCCAAWITGLINNLTLDAELSIAGFLRDDAPVTAVCAGRRIDLIKIDENASPEVFAKKIKELRPDAVVIFGTEKDHTQIAVEACKAAGVISRTALFAQGIAFACAEHYLADVPVDVAKRYTFRDAARRSNIMTEKKVMEKRAEVEKNAIGQIRHFIGRTSLDYAALRRYNRTAKYYRCNDFMRPCFYSGSWSYEDCEPYRLFVSQYYYPLKGFHFLLKAVSELKERYPKLKIAAAGYNPVNSGNFKKELKDSSYIRYIKELILKYGLEKNIEFLGELSEEEMKREYLKANVFVLPSSIENSPNSLGEAMLLGVPSVASFVGGVGDLATHTSDALLYPSGAPYLLAHYIDELFGDPQQAAALGKRAKERAGSIYDIERNRIAFEEALISIADSD